MTTTIAYDAAMRKRMKREKRKNEENENCRRLLVICQSYYLLHSYLTEANRTDTNNKRCESTTVERWIEGEKN